MTYFFNPHAHVKIWLSENPDVFLPFENQLRLIRMRQNLKNDAISLIYDSQLLKKGTPEKPESEDELLSFCTKHNIRAVDIRTEVIPNCLEYEKKLIPLYDNEVANLGINGGITAVGSDILRLLSPVYKLGTYSDFDIKVDTRNMPEKIETETPLLFNIDSEFCNLGPNNIEGVSLVTNNDIIAVVDPAAAEADIKKIQERLLFNCSIKDETNQKTAFGFHVEKVQTSFRTICDLDSSYTVEYEENYILDCRLDSIQKDLQCNAQELRKEIIKYKLAWQVLNDNDNFIELLKSTEEYPFYLKKLTKENISGLKQFIINNPNNIEVVKKARLLLLESIENEISKFRIKPTEKPDFDSFLIRSVISTSGPSVITALFDYDVYKENQYNQNVKPYTLNHYNLDKVFITNQTKSFGEAELSWLKIGQKKRDQRELKLTEKAYVIQNIFREKKGKVLASNADMEHLTDPNKTNIKTTGPI